MVKKFAANLWTEVSAHHSEAGNELERTAKSSIFLSAATLEKTKILVLSSLRFATGRSVVRINSPERELQSCHKDKHRSNSAKS
jgi:hypothetical protein